MKNFSLLLLFLLAGAFSMHAQSISKAEYYFDTDPGVGKATALSFTAAGAINASFNLSIGSLPPGVHKLYIRFGFSTGEWGPSADQLFYVDKDTGSAHSAVNAMEGFYDTDPGPGKGISLKYPSATPDNTVINSALPVSSLSKGWHTMYIRARLSNGVWGPLASNFFLIQKPLFTEAVTGIIKMEYAIDSDTPVGRKTDIPFGPVPADSVKQAFVYNVGMLALGKHKIIVRAQNGYGIWSKDSTMTFTVQNAAGIQGAADELNNIIIYPNPFHEIVTLHGKFEHLQVLDIAGKELLHVNSATGQDNYDLDMSNFPAGVYLIKLTSGMASSVRKLVKN